MSLFSTDNGRIFLLLFLLFVTRCSAQKRTIHCENPSSCGEISNISYPFRFHGDPESCGDPNYELYCENNTTVRYKGTDRFIVQSINYENRTIRVVDDDLQNNNCSTLPRYSSFDSYAHPFYSDYDYYYDYYYHSYYYDYNYNYYNNYYNDYNYPQYNFASYIVFVSCENQVKSSDYIDTSPCLNTTKSPQKKRYSYVLTGDFELSKMGSSCSIDLVVPSSSPVTCQKNCSYLEIHNQMSYGIEFSWNNIYCQECNGTEFYCLFNEKLTEFVSCDFPDYRKCGLACVFKRFISYYIIGRLAKPIVIITIIKFACGFPFVVALLMYKWRRRHLSMYDTIEDFLQSHNNLMPIRYSYLNLQLITRGLKEKLGEGGYGSVYKGKLRGGREVAVKVLGKSSKANGQEFINEVATIGRIHHVNVVRLIGFCADRSKRALVYDFMPNGSLEKYLFSKGGNSNTNLSFEKMYEISLGVARGIEYLHRGCDIQILHFDIKPHNILLDENFNPKVSDFGLAKLYPTENSIVPLTGARGTMGYMAPELFYKNIGGISYKADVYSFGMLLMEMAGRRKNLNAYAEHPSQIYFPSWAYEQINEGKDIQMDEVATDEDKKYVKKMMITALWCIQMKPSDRPSMNKVVEMLEGEIESIPIPPKPFVSPREATQNPN